MAKRFIIIKSFCILSIFSSFLIIENTNSIPIYFKEFDITILNLPRVRDAIIYNKSKREYFKLIIYAPMGKSYCERYIDGKIYEKGNFENSLDTLKKYISGRYSDNSQSPIRVEKYFQPLKDGNWLIYKKGNIIYQHYSMGIMKGR